MGKYHSHLLGRNIKKGDIKFGVILADIPTFQVDNMIGNQSYLIEVEKSVLIIT